MKFPNKLNQVVYLFFTLIFQLQVNAQDRSLMLTNVLNDFGANASLLSNNANKIQLNARFLSTTLKGKYQNINASYGLEIAKTNYLGIKIMSDERNAYSLINAELIYAKLLKINQKNKVSFGVNTGVMQASNSRTFLNEYVDLSDANLNNNFNSLQFTAGAGISYTNADRFSLAFSLPIMILGDQKVNSAYTVNLAYRFSANSKLDVTPKVNTYRLTNRSMTDLGIGFSWKKMIEFSSYYRTNSSLVHALKYTGKTFHFGYAINHSIGSLRKLYQGTHEIMLAFTLSKVKVGNLPEPSEMDKAKKELFDIKLELMRVKNSSVEKEEATKVIVNANTKLKKIVSMYKIDNAPELSKDIEEIQVLIGELMVKYR